jgi:peptidoglycan L-alanyl-D-glutamate endopeptidase CwlK
MKGNSIGQRALMASLRNSAGPKLNSTMKAIKTMKRDARDLQQYLESELLHYDPRKYRVKGYDKPAPLTRLVRENPRQYSKRYADRADWRGVDPRIKEWAQTFCARLNSKRLPMHVNEAMRSDERQAELYRQGRSSIKNRGEHGKGRAVDIVHSIEFWNLTEGEWASIGMLGHTLATELGLQLRWGGDWDNDGDMHDHKLWDPAHWELAKGF